MLDSGARSIVEGFEDQLLLAQGPVAEEAVVPYTDPALLRSTAGYESFVADLFDRHLVGFTQCPRTVCGIFFVN